MFSYGGYTWEKTSRVIKKLRSPLNTKKKKKRNKYLVYSLPKEKKCMILHIPVVRIILIDQLVIHYWERLFLTLTSKPTGTSSPQ